jgi:integrase
VKLGDLNKDLIIIEWLDILNPKHNTKKNYLLAMQTFTEWANKNPNELLEEAEEEISNGILPRRRKIKSYLIGFRKYLQDTGRAPTTVKGYMTGVKSFYRCFDIELPNLPRQDKRAKPLEKHNKIPTKEDLQEVLKICDPLEKAVLLIGAASGLSAQEIITLKVGDFKNGYDRDDGITILELVREKTGVRFCTFLTPEASNAILNYMAFRGRTEKTGKLDRLNHLKKQNVLSDNDFLFIRRHIYDSYLENGSEDERRLDTDAFMKVYRGISEKAQKNTPYGDWNLIRSHNIRKFYNSTLYNAGCQAWFIEYTMGHTLDDTRSAYFRASPEKLKEIYKKFVPYLTVQKELDLSESPEYQAIKSENDILRAETAKHVVERQEITALKNEVERGNIDRAELNALRNEIDSLYREMRGTQEGYKVGTKLVQKIHPNRIILKPDDGSDVEPDY